jgi:hypothetical protein
MAVQAWVSRSWSWWSRAAASRVRRSRRSLSGIIWRSCSAAHSARSGSQAAMDCSGTWVARSATVRSISARRLAWLCRSGPRPGAALDAGESSAADDGERGGSGDEIAVGTAGRAGCLLEAVPVRGDADEPISGWPAFGDMVGADGSSEGDEVAADGVGLEPFSVDADRVVERVGAPAVLGVEGEERGALDHRGAEGDGTVVVGDGDRSKDANLDHAVGEWRWGWRLPRCWARAARRMAAVRRSLFGRRRCRCCAVWRAGPERFRFGKWSKVGWLIADF